ncbi:hypothetical protein CBL_04452 [Carabus blaptoides fortunei]
MAVKYLFLIFLVNMPLVIGFYINGMPKELHQDYTSKPMVYNDQYGNQQTMVCIPVPVIIQGMNPENTSRLEHRDSTSQGEDGQEESLIGNSSMESGPGHQLDQGSGDSEMVRGKKRTKVDSGAQRDEDTSSGSEIAKKSKKDKPGTENSNEDVTKSTDTGKEAVFEPEMRAAKERPLLRVKSLIMHAQCQSQFQPVKMLLKYLVLAGIPLVFGLQIRPEQPSSGTTCNCNCNFPKPMSYFDPYVQQAMVCIPVPINIQRMYPQNAGRPEYPIPMIEQTRPKNIASLEEPTYPSDYGSVPARLALAPVNNQFYPPYPPFGFYPGFYPGFAPPQAVPSLGVRLNLDATTEVPQDPLRPQVPVQSYAGVFPVRQNPFPNNPFLNSLPGRGVSAYSGTFSG